MTGLGVSGHDPHSVAHFVNRLVFCMFAEDGWGEDYRAGTLTDDEILARLFHLNQKRASA